MPKTFAFLIVVTVLWSGLASAQEGRSADTSAAAVAAGDPAKPADTASASTGAAHGVAQGAVIFPGDSVKVTIWKEPDISGTFQVDENSILVLPMLGPRSVANTSAEQLRSQLIQDYSAQLKNPSISVSITRRVSVLGAVEKPGLYAVDPTMQLGDIVALAGGVTEEGSSKNIDVERGSTRLYENLELSDAVVPNLRSGDRVVVDKRSWLSRNGKAAFATGLGVATIIARFTIWH